MSVLEAPQTWIAAAAVLVVIAVVLIALAPRRRGASTGDTAGDGASSAAPDTARSPDHVAALPSSGPVSTDDPRLDDDAVTGPVTPARGVDRSTDDAVTAETPPWAGHGTATDAPAAATVTATAGADRAVTPAGGVPLTRSERRYVPVTDPARADERAKDRLLAVLLADPTAAVDVVAAMPETDGASGASAAALLRAGLSPTQVAGLCGVDERDLADLVARDLGLLEVLTASGQEGRSRSEEPGRAWASAGSSSSSTTPTTG